MRALDPTSCPTSPIAESANFIAAWPAGGNEQITALTVRLGTLIVPLLRCSLTAQQTARRLVLTCRQPRSA